MTEKRNKLYLKSDEDFTNRISSQKENYEKKIHQFRHNLKVIKSR